MNDNYDTDPTRPGLRRELADAWGSLSADERRQAAFVIAGTALALAAFTIAVVAALGQMGF